MEINLDNLCGKVLKGVRDTVNSSFNHSRNDYKPGGTINIVQGDVVGRIIKSGQDEMGQWIYAKLAVKNDKIIKNYYCTPAVQRLVEVDEKWPSRKKKLYFG
eukprot:4922326-Ditylum_brightwellii.AAC.1